MRAINQMLVFPLCLLLAMSTPALADGRHAVDRSALAATVSQHVATQDADRAAVREALSRPEIRDVASHVGLDLTRADASVDTMSGADLQQAAAAAHRVNSELVGGASTLVISTTAIALILVLVLVVIIAVK